MRNYRPEPAASPPPVSNLDAHAEAGPSYTYEPEVAAEVDLRASQFVVVGGGKVGLGFGSGSGFAAPGASVVQDPDARGPWRDPVAFCSGDEDELASELASELAASELASSATTMEELDPIATAEAYGFSGAAVGVGGGGGGGDFGGKPWDMFGVGPGVAGAGGASVTAAGKDCATGVGRDMRGTLGGGGAERECLPRGWGSSNGGGGLRDEGGDIDGGNAVDSVAEVAETYLLSGSDEEGYQEIEDALAAEHWLDITDAMLGQTHPDPGLGVG